MTNLIRTEWLKIRKYRAFWWMLGIVTLSYPGINYMFFEVWRDITSEETATAMIIKMMGNPFAFPDTWQTVAFFSSFFVFIPAVMVIMFITNEYTYKTHRQNIIDGWSRNQFMLSKLIDVLLITFIITLLCVIVTLAIGFSNMGASKEGVNIWGKMHFVPLFALLTFAQLSLAFLVAFLVRKAFIALGIFLFYYVVLENVMVAYAKERLNDIGKYLPFELSDRIVPFPQFFSRMNNTTDYKDILNRVNEHVVYTILLTAAVWALCFWLNKRRDL